MDKARREAELKLDFETIKRIGEGTGVANVVKLYEKQRKIIVTYNKCLQQEDKRKIRICTAATSR